MVYKAESTYVVCFYTPTLNKICIDFDTLYEYTSCIWSSFVYHSRLTICDCLRFTKVCFCLYTSEKQFCLNDINSSVMPRLDEHSCTVSRQQHWTDCGTSWPDVMLTKSIVDCSRADQS
jgi:hypothetical protein